MRAAAKFGRWRFQVFVGISALAIAVVFVIVTVTGASNIANFFLKGSGTATVQIQLGTDVPKFAGSLGKAHLAGQVKGEGYEPKATVSGTIDGTRFKFDGTLVVPKTANGQYDLYDLYIRASGTFGSMPVKGTLDWVFPHNLRAREADVNSESIPMTVQGTVGSHQLRGSGVVTSRGSNRMTAVFHYSIS